VSDASSSSFWFIYHSHSGSHWHSAVNQTDWEQWSDVQVKLSGGDVLGHGQLTMDNTLDADDVARWQTSIKQNKMVPLQCVIVTRVHFSFAATPHAWRRQRGVSERWVGARGGTQTPCFVAEH
jgi:hypothetical protein